MQCSTSLLLNSERSLKSLLAEMNDMSDLPQKIFSGVFFTFVAKKKFLQIISVGLWRDKEKSANEPSDAPG